MTTTNIYVISGKGKYYIGKANNLNTRFSQHKAKARKGDGNPQKAKWILQNERHLNLSRIETVDASEWREREMYWIAHYRRKYGYNAVMNSTDGGEGPLMKEELKPQTNNGFGVFLILVGIAACFTGLVGIGIGILLITIGQSIY